MPNHIHLLLSVSAPAGGASPSPTVVTDVPSVIGALKSLITREWHLTGGANSLWQRSFYDHIVRGEAEYIEVAEYIENNPARWREDRFYAPA